ncbi:MAG: AfsR/SARP family transcriptional regulator [Bacillota bacterium]|jgi:DNA-binding SARP family transcriptional activator
MEERTQPGDVISEPNASCLRRVLELLKYLIVFRNRRMLPEVIIDEMWPCCDFVDPKSVLRTQVSRLRSLIREMVADSGFEDAPWMQLNYSNGCYVLELDDSCRVDADVFEETVACAEAMEQEDIWAAIDLYKEVLDLYKGPYMAGQVRGEWLFPVQNHYQRVYMRALFRLLDLLKSANALKEITEICEKAFLIEPHDEALHLCFLQALADLGDTKSTLSHYSYFTAFLDRELGVKPSAPLRAFYRKLQQRMDAAYETDLMLIKKNLIDDELSGAFGCEIDHFRVLCQVEIRRSLRTDNPVFLGMITVSGLDKSRNHKQVQSVRGRIDQMLSSSLRKGDVFAWWNQTQVLILLALRKRDDLNCVGQRLHARLQEIADAERVRARLEFQPLTAEVSFLAY